MRPTAAQLEAIFQAALAIADVSKRTAFLDQACAGNHLLRQQIDALLKAESAADSFFDPCLARSTVASPGGGVGVLESEERPGTEIGHYRLVEELGRGGFGVVYRARQSAPVQREVAIKIIKLGMDTREVVRRFEAERQALALMSHPHIAAIYDAGATSSGRPYFVMELVPGIPITAYCDREVLGVAARLRLFIRVCQAVQHAHQKGVIHRDLKPSNILVSPAEGQPCPKIIDFGIVKATNQALPQTTWVTRAQEILGTPAYMSPEQAAPGQLDVDTRADVYSLGALLYELLTGHPPLESAKLDSSSLEAVLQIIREEQPPKPSVRFRQIPLAERQALAALRGCAPEQMVRALLGDLDWIALKALEKDRSLRYASALALAEDVERYLNYQPVLAAAPSTTYQLRKFVKRHRTAVIMASALAAILVISSVVSGWLAYRAIRAERQSAREAANARRQAGIAEATRKFLTEDLLGAADPMLAHRLDISVRQVLDRASREVGSQFATEPLIEAEIRATLTRIHSNLGDHASALTHATRTLELRRAALGETDRETLRAQRSLAVEYLALRGQDPAHLARAERLLTEAWRHCGQVLAPEDEVAVDVAAALASAWFAQQRFQGARELTELALGRWTNASGLRNPRAAHMLANLAGSYAQSPEGQRDPAGVQRYFEQALAVATLAFGEGSPNRLPPLINLGLFHLNRGSYPLAEVPLREAVDLAKATVGPLHPWTWSASRELARLYVRQGKLAEATALATSELTARWQGQGVAEPSSIEAVTQIGVDFENQGAVSEAAVLYELSLSRMGALRPRDPPGLARVAYWMVATQRYLEADQLLELMEPHIDPADPDSSGFTILNRRALLNLVAGCRAEYHALCNRLEAQFARTTSPAIASALLRTCLADPQRDPEPFADARQRWHALLHRQQRTGPGSSGIELTLGLDRYRAGDWSGAVTHFTGALEGPLASRATTGYLLALVHVGLREVELSRQLFTDAEQTAAALPGSRFAWWDEYLLLTILREEARSAVLPRESAARIRGRR